MTFDFRNRTIRAQNGVNCGHPPVSTILIVGLACVIAFANFWISGFVTEPTQPAALLLPPREEDERSIPVKVKTRSVPKVEQAKSTPTKGQERSVPTEEQAKSTPTEEQAKSTPIEEQEKRTPIEEQENRATPTEGQEKRTPIEEQEKRTPTEEQEKRTPIEKQEKRTPTEEQDKRTPTEEQDKSTPTQEQDKSAPTQEQDKNTTHRDVTESRAVRFIPLDHIPNENHYFSAAWWQSKERFMRTLEPSRIGSLEAAVFSFIYPDDLGKDLRMTSDWLKFSVEHLSHYWKIVTGYENPSETQAYNLLVEKTLDHVYRMLSAIRQNEAGTMAKNGQEDTHETTYKESSSSAMTETIAVVAFGPYKSYINATRGHVLTTAVAASTLMSLIRVNCGRLLIVVEQSDLDKTTAQVLLAIRHVLLQDQGDPQQLIQLLHEGSESPFKEARTALESFFMSSSSVSLADAVLHVNATNIFEYQVHQTEIAVVVVSCADRLIQKAALIGLKKAFDDDDILHTQQWLGRGTTGGSNKYNYTYFTEADTILHVKQDAMAALSVEVRQGSIVVPHRLQPIPHERDLPGYNPDLVVPFTATKTNITSTSGSSGTTTIINDELTVMNMGTNDLCCDAGPSAPGFVEMGVCGRYWWACGFGEVDEGKADENLRNATKCERHFRLMHYTVIDLQEGTRIVLLAGSEHGRRCLPKKALTLQSGNDEDLDCI